MEKIVDYLDTPLFYAFVSAIAGTIAYGYFQRKKKEKEEKEKGQDGK